MSSVKRAKVTKAVVDLLRTELDHKVGYGTRPSDTDEGDQAYHVVTNVSVGQSAYVGSAWQQRESMERVRFLIVTVGTTVEQAESLNDLAASVLVDRDDTPGSLQPVHAITVADHVVLDRKKMGTLPTSGTKPPQAGTYVELFVGISD